MFDILEESNEKLIENVRTEVLIRNEYELLCFIETANMIELTSLLKQCEDDELYEYCAIIYNRIKQIKPLTNLIEELWQGVDPT